MKILLTGGAGFIGSNFIYYLLNHYSDYRIVCLDKLTYAGNFRTLAEAVNNLNFEFVKGDICDAELVDNLFKNNKFDFVINFAAESHVDRSIINPHDFLLTNVVGTQVLMDACRQYGNVRFHQLSTDEVYGDLTVNDDLKFNEKAPLRPNNPYSSSKAAADLLALSYYRTYGLPITISRSSNNYGRYQNLEKLIPLAITNAFCGRDVPIYGDGENVRDWLHVKDHCRALDLIIHKGIAGEVYNICAHNETTNLELVKAILNILGKSRELIKFVEDRAGHDRRYAIDSSKIFSEFGWKPTINFYDGLRNTVKWYVDNVKWWK